MHSEFLASEHLEKRGADSIGNLGNHRGWRRRLPKDHVNKNRVVTAPVRSDAMLDADYVWITSEKRPDPLNPSLDFVLLNQS